jgi:hypothetical protein
MAASRATVVQSLSIALIVFVMLTFVLAITTYLFFKQQVDEQAKADAAVAEATKSKGELNTDLEEKKKLQEIIGLAEDKTAADVEADTTETFSSKFSDFQEDPKNYKNLSEWLKKAIEAKDKTLQEKDAEIAKEKAAAVAAAEEADKARKQLEEKVAEREKEAAGLKQSFDADRAKAEQRQQELVAAQKAALDRATKLEQINAEIAKGEAFLSSSRQTRFKGQPPEARVGLFFEELRDNEKVIQRQNTLLADLRAADKALQDTVLDAVPKNEREEGFDGRIVSINEADRTVLIDFRSTAAVRPGLLFAVYDPTWLRKRGPSRWSASRAHRWRGPGCCATRSATRSSRATRWPRACGRFRPRWRWSSSASCSSIVTPSRIPTACRNSSGGSGDASSSRSARGRRCSSTPGSPRRSAGRANGCRAGDQRMIRGVTSSSRRRAGWESGSSRSTPSCRRRGSTATRSKPTGWSGPATSERPRPVTIAWPSDTPATAARRLAFSDRTVAYCRGSAAGLGPATPIPPGRPAFRR